MTLPTYTVWFRGYPACPCLAEWLPVYEAELQRLGVLTGPLRIYQLIGNASASANTHRDGGAFDITDLVGDLDVWIARQMGADATWARTAAQGFTPHLHGVLTGCPHNAPARYQIDAVRSGGNGLGSGGLGGVDDGPRPLSGRTWRQGIEWAKQRQEDDMADYATQLDDIDKKLDALLKGQDKAQRQNAAIRGKVTKLVQKGSATRADLAELLAAFDAEEG